MSTLRSQPADERGHYRMPVYESVQQAIDVGRSFKPLTETEKTALLNKTAQAAKNGQFELYKTSDHFDGTAHNPQWLG